MAARKGNRLHLRIEPELKAQVRDYCVRNHTNITDVVTRFFVRLLAEDEKKRNTPDDAPQI